MVIWVKKINYLLYVIFEFQSEGLNINYDLTCCQPVSIGLESRLDYFAFQAGYNVF